MTISKDVGWYSIKVCWVGHTGTPTCHSPSTVIESGAAGYFGDEVPDGVDIVEVSFPVVLVLGGVYDLCGFRGDGTTQTETGYHL